MDKQRTENMASDDAEEFMRNTRSSKISEEDTGCKPSIGQLREAVINRQRQLANQRSQKNAEHDARCGDSSDAARSRLAKFQLPEDAHVPQG
jgi:hypothetical protein